VGKVLLALALLLPAVATQAPPASASTSTNAVGFAEFEGNAFLPKFPCPQTAVCSGTFSGQWSGNLSGFYNGREFDIAWRTLGNTGVNASFTYEEFFCAIPTAGNAVGHALGLGTARGGPSQVVGTMYNNNPNQLPVLIDEIVMDFSFEWLRAANGAGIILNPVSFLAVVPGLGTVPLVTSQQVGTADFVPTGSSTPGGVPNCSTPLQNITGAITGNISFAHNP
jgi:hypothetical protein